MSRIVLLFFLACSATFLMGCGTTKEDTTRKDREKISTVPWNKPENWEGKGALGGFVQ